MSDTKADGPNKQQIDENAMPTSQEEVVRIGFLLFWHLIGNLRSLLKKLFFVLNSNTLHAILKL